MVLKLIVGILQSSPEHLVHDRLVLLKQARIQQHTLDLNHAAASIQPLTRLMYHALIELKKKKISSKIDSKNIFQMEMEWNVCLLRDLRVSLTCNG